MNIHTAFAQLRFRRFGRLLLRELAHGYRGLLIAMAAVAGGVIVFTAIGALAASAGGAPAGTVSGDGYFGFFQTLLFLGGFIITSLAFREVWQTGSGIAYLMLPGSLFEKFVVKLLMTSVGFAAGALIFMSATALASDGLDRLLFGVGRGFFNPVAPAVLQAVVRYLVLQSFFLLGSIWFRKLAFVKTALSIVVFGIALSIVSTAALRIGLASHFALGPGHGMRLGGWAFDLNGAGLQNLFRPGGRGYSGAMAFKVAAEALFIALAPASWVAAYFRLGEAEV
ncbi:MAG: hypothetical protein ABSG21_05585 [Spirochaetia bacterium]|jgi:hypothetical protein